MGSNPTGGIARWCNGSIQHSECCGHGSSPWRAFYCGAHGLLRKSLKLTRTGSNPSAAVVTFDIVIFGAVDQLGRSRLSQEQYSVGSNPTRATTNEGSMNAFYREHNDGTYSNFSEDI